MNSILKSQNFSQEDKITNLPSSLKTKILSCLPTKDAVKTSILSREWKRAWTFVSNLDFDDVDHGWTMVLEEEFVHFVNRVLMLHERSYLQRFRMRCERCYEGSRVNTWIAAVLLSRVEELDLSVPVEYPNLLNSDIFTCKTLTVLKLDVNGRVNMPTSVCLPHLKTLHLANLKLLDDASITNLLSGCFVIEELNLHRCIGDDVRVVNIIAPTLTNLTLEHLPCHDKRSDGGEYRYEIVLDTPALEFLNLDDDNGKGYTLKNLNHLIEAVLTVGITVADDGMDGDEVSETRSRAITDLLNGISQVESLVLSELSVWAIDLCDPALPIFSNLTSLEYGTTGYFEWCYLLKLLKNSPCLEALYLNQGSNDTHEEYLPVPTDEVPCCFLSHLKVIEIYDFEGFANDTEMVDFFLENAKVLEKLTIYCEEGAYSHVEKDDYYTQLLMLRKASNDCNVEVL